jgi:hypothetical protein
VNVIDSSTGALVLGKNRLSPGTIVSEFLASELGKEAREVVRTDDLKSFSLTLTESAQQVNYVLTFVHGVLRMAIAAVGLPNEGGWDDWSPALERQRKLRNDSILKQWIGTTKAKFRWGYAESGSDPKTGASIISVHYSDIHGSQT